MSKIISGIGKVVKGVVKAVKKVASSKLGKIALLAGAVYLGGGALGAWNTPFSSINGALKVGSAVSNVAGGASTGANYLAGNQIATTAAANAATTAAAAAPAASGGLISNAVSGITGFVKANPITAAMGLNALSNATNPDQLDIERERNDRERANEEEDRNRINNNLNVANVDIGVDPNDNNTLYDNQGNPIYSQGGILNKYLNKNTT